MHNTNIEFQNSHPLHHQLLHQDLMSTQDLLYISVDASRLQTSCYKTSRYQQSIDNTQCTTQTLSFRTHIPSTTNYCIKTLCLLKICSTYLSTLQDYKRLVIRLADTIGINLQCLTHSPPSLPDLSPPFIFSMHYSLPIPQACVCRFIPSCSSQ